jgi:hypothetical protein
MFYRCSCVFRNFQTCMIFVAPRIIRIITNNPCTLNQILHIHSFMRQGIKVAGRSRKLRKGLSSII